MTQSDSPLGNCDQGLTVLRCVLSGAAVAPVGRRAAVDDVVAGQRRDYVVSAAACEGVVSGHWEVGKRGAGDRVVPSGTRGLAAVVVTDATAAVLERIVSA